MKKSRTRAPQGWAEHIPLLFPNGQVYTTTFFPPLSSSLPAVFSPDATNVGFWSSPIPRFPTTLSNRRGWAHFCSTKAQNHFVKISAFLVDALKAIFQGHGWFCFRILLPPNQPPLWVHIGHCRFLVPSQPEVRQGRDPTAQWYSWMPILRMPFCQWWLYAKDWNSLFIYKYCAIFFCATQTEC